MSSEATGQITLHNVTVEDRGIRISECPRCGNPIVLDIALKTGTFGECPWEDCGAWVAYDVNVTATAFNTRAAAKAKHEDGGGDP